MTEEEFLTHLAFQENQTIHYWFYNSVWYTADIQLYNERHRLYGQIDGHEEYLEAIRKNQERLENCYCMIDLVCGACR